MSQLTLTGGGPSAGGGASSNWWEASGVSAWAAYQPKGAASFAVSLTDLTGNGRDAGDPGGASTPAWDSTNGWKGDGSADYLTTTFVPNVDQTQSVFVQFTNAPTGYTALVGCRDTIAATHYFEILPSRRADLNYVVYTNGDSTGSGVSASPRLAAGNLGIAGAQGYRNGSADGNALGAGSGTPDQAIYILATNNSGVIQLYTTAYIQAFIIFDVALTGPQASAIAVAMAAL